MKKLILLAGLLAITGCTSMSSQMGGSHDPDLAMDMGCQMLDNGRLDLALKAYGTGLDAIGLLIDTGVLKPGSAQSKAVADANDKVLAAFVAADKALKICDSSTYNAAIATAADGIVQVRKALKGEKL